MTADRWTSFAQDREPFVVILLDGEGIIFKDEFLQLGEEGGRKAANQFHTAMHAYLTKSLPSIHTPKLMTKIYMNVKGFGELCARSGLVTDAAAIHDFIRGFNETMSFSEIIDVGSGKNKSLDKIQGLCSPHTTAGESQLIRFYTCRDLPGLPIQLPLPSDLPGLSIK